MNQKVNLVNYEDRDQPLLGYATEKYDAARFVAIISVMGGLSGKVMGAALTYRFPLFWLMVRGIGVLRDPEIFIQTESFTYHKVE